MITPLDILYIIILLNIAIIGFTAFNHIKNAIASIFYKIKRRDMLAYHNGIKIMNKEKPLVAIVIPTRNEGDIIANTVEYMIKNVTYDNYIIIIGDDSTDKYSIDVIKKLEKKYQNKVIVYHREKNIGWKGGCLNEIHNNIIKKLGIKYYYVFDSDWIPQPDFIEKTLPYMLGDEKIGIVQFSRVLDIRKATFTQKLASSIIEAAYTVDLPARYVLGEWILFTGSAGLLRTEAIDKAGGWRGHITEDIDLSIRVTLSGYRVIYIRDVKTFGIEAPPTLTAFLKQQIRWAKGTYLVFVEYFTRVIFGKLPLRYKLSFIYQFMLYFSSVLVLATIILTLLYDILLLYIPPDLSILLALKVGYILQIVTYLYLIASIIEPIVHIIKNRIRDIALFPIMILYMWTTIISYTMAVFEKSVWIRTPRQKTKQIYKPIFVTYLIVAFLVTTLSIIEIIVYKVPIQPYHILYPLSIYISPIISILS